MNRYVLAVLVVGSLLALVGFLIRPPLKPLEQPSANPAGTPPVTVDEHGCDVAGGSVWCEPKQKCLKLWEEKCEGVVPATESAKPSPAVTK